MGGPCIPRRGSPTLPDRLPLSAGLGAPMPRNLRHLLLVAVVTLCVGVCVGCFALLQTGHF